MSPNITIETVLDDLAEIIAPMPAPARAAIFRKTQEILSLTAIEFGEAIGDLAARVSLRTAAVLAEPLPPGDAPAGCQWAPGDPFRFCRTHLRICD